MTQLIFLSGSTRKDSMNTKLARLAADFATEAGADAKFIDLSEYDMPIYNGDLEAANGMPEAGRRLKKEFVDCKGFFIASPEYNSSFSALLKNTLDWISRKEDGTGGDLSAYKGKVAALSAASPGGFGGLRGLVPLRMMLGNIGVHVLPDQLVVPVAHTAFDASGKLDDKTAKALQGLVKTFIETTKKLG